MSSTLSAAQPTLCSTPSSNGPRAPGFGRYVRVCGGVCVCVCVWGGGGDVSVCVWGGGACMHACIHVGLCM